MSQGSKSMFAHFNQKYWTQKYLLYSIVLDCTQLYSFELVFTRFYPKITETHF